jgi:hypothetical protein
MSLPNTFTVYGDDNAKYTIRQVHSRVDTATMEGESSIPGLSSLILVETEERINMIDENTFKRVISGEILRRRKS